MVQSHHPTRELWTNEGRVDRDNPLSVYTSQPSDAGVLLDAWGRPKSVIDISLLNGLFTYTIPPSKWKELVNGVEQASFTCATSDDGKLKLEAPATLNDRVTLSTFRNPRYEPNRSLNYASSIILPDPTALGERDFGIFLDSGESGVYFRCKSDGKLYACLDSYYDGSNQQIFEEEITIPFDLDLSKGFIADIQAQWRGVGNFGFWLGDPATGRSALVKTLQFMNTSAELSMYNPANPISFRCKNLGDRVVINCGCVDLSSEGGLGTNNEYGAIGLTNTSGQVAISGTNQPVLAVRSKELIGSLTNTRDILAFAASAYADQRAVFRVWVTRDDTALTLNDQSWTDFRDGHLEFIMYDLNGDGTPLVGTPMTFDITKAINTFTSRVDQDQTFVTPAPEGDGKIWQTPGDLFIFTMARETGGSSNVGVTYEFLEAI